MKKIFVLAVMLAMVLGFSMQAHAALQNLGTDSTGNLLIYDSDLNITWYDYTHEGAQEWGDTWQNQVVWAGTLSITFGGSTFDDWRLPSVFDPSNLACNTYTYNENGPCGYNVDPNTGEMAHLFDELGNLAYYDINGDPAQANWGLLNTGEFDNLQTGPYWTGTEYANYTPYAWYYHLNYDNQEYMPKTHEYRAIAVMAGMAVGAVVPEPISSTLFIIGGATLGFRRFRKHFKKSAY